MAGVDVGESGGRRKATNSDINMIPFIDLLMVTIAFLLITAVWVTNSRIDASAQAPGAKCTGDCGETPERTLHVSIAANEFNLAWRQAGTVLSETKVPRSPQSFGSATRYPDLARVITAEWTRQGAHTDPSDRRVDQVVLHADDKAPFKEIVGVLDAINATQRDMRFGDGLLRKIAAFQTTFSAR